MLSSFEVQLFNLFMENSSFLKKNYLFSSCELWCGQTQGKISIYSATDSVVTSQEIVYHYDPIVDNLDVYQLVGGFCEKPIVWSYVYPGMFCKIL